MAADQRARGRNLGLGAGSDLRQPEARFVAAAELLTSANDGYIAFGLDPTKGQLLKQLVNVPSWKERATTQGGTVGWIIIYLGSFGIIVAILRILWMLNPWN